MADLDAAIRQAEEALAKYDTSVAEECDCTPGECHHSVRDDVLCRQCIPPLRVLLDAARGSGTAPPPDTEPDPAKCRCGHMGGKAPCSYCESWSPGPLPPAVKQAGTKDVFDRLRSWRIDADRSDFAWRLLHLDVHAAADEIARLRAAPLPPVPHAWTIPLWQVWESCSRCGVVRRADDKNKPCPGAVPVVLRAPLAQAVAEAAENLVRKIDEVDNSPEYLAVWGLFWTRGLEYKGPRYETELKALKAALWPELAAALDAAQKGGPR